MNTGGDKEIGRYVLLSIVPCVYMMTHNSNDVIASTAITFPFLSPAASSFSLPFLVVGVIVDVVIVVGVVVVVVVVVMFKLLYLAEICTLTSAF